jgi:hypothetical protein
MRCLPSCGSATFHPMVFKVAVRGLEAGKRKQIKDWVLILNREREGATNAG